MLALWCTLAASAWPGGLGRAVKKELADPGLAGAVVSVYVENHRGRSMVDEGGDLRVVPASTVKWVTAVAAADTLGLDHRFRTRFAATGHLEGSTLVGDLVLIGDGDPSLGLEGPEVLLQQVSGVLAAGGIRRVRGRLIVASDVVGDGPLGTGWMWDDLRFTYSAPFGAVNLAHNMPHPATLVCESVDGPATPLVDPDACAAQVFHEAITGSGVRIEGDPIVAPRPNEVLTDLVVWESLPLRDLLRTMLQTSDNLYAESIARALDRDGVRTFRGARESLYRVMAKAGVGTHEARLADGSGLSRYSMISGAALVRLTRWAEEQPWGAELRDLLAVMGRSGTLEQRGRGTPAEGRVWGKTGSMSGVRNIVGVARDAKGRPVRFAVLFNGLVVSRAVAIELQDRILSLVTVSRGRNLRRQDRIAVTGGGG